MTREPAGPPQARHVPELRRRGREVVEAYYRVRFGDEPADPSETNRLRQALRAGRGD